MATKTSSLELPGPGPTGQSHQSEGTEKWLGRGIEEGKQIPLTLLPGEQESEDTERCVGHSQDHKAIVK